MQSDGENPKRGYKGKQGSLVMPEGGPEVSLCVCAAFLMCIALEPARNEPQNILRAVLHRIFSKKGMLRTIYARKTEGLFVAPKLSRASASFSTTGDLRANIVTFARVIASSIDHEQFLRPWRLSKRVTLGWNGIKHLTLNTHSCSHQLARSGDILDT